MNGWCWEFVFEDVKERVFCPVAGPFGFVIYPGAVNFGAADEGPGVKGIIEGVTPVDEMGGVVQELRCVARFAEDRRQCAGVEGQWFPGVKGAAVFAGHDVGAIGDGGKARCEGAVETPGL